IGGSGTDPARHHVGYPSLFGPEQGKPGWPAYIERVAEPVVQAMREAGHKPRIVISNPFGLPPEEAGRFMRFDAWYSSPSWLRDGFEEAWKPWLEKNKDVEVICYLGTLYG